MPREYFKGTWQEDRSFSPVVATRGGRTLWLAGVGAREDEEGNSLAGDFEGHPGVIPLEHRNLGMVQAALRLQLRDVMG